jgi:hypothetical protein
MQPKQMEPMALLQTKPNSQNNAALQISNQTEQATVVNLLIAGEPVDHSANFSQAARWPCRSDVNTPVTLANYTRNGRTEGKYSETSGK